MRNLLAASAVALLAACHEAPDPARGPSAGEFRNPPAPGPGPGTAGVEKIKVISRGTAYDPKDYRIPGYVVVLDFYADW